MAKPKGNEITEKVWEKQVKDLLRTFGFEFYYHTWNSYRSAKGFPDVVALNPEQNRLLLAELKSETGQPTEDQYCWLMALQAAGYEAYLWRPSDFEEIAGLLRRNGTNRESELVAAGEGEESR